MLICSYFSIDIASPFSNKSLILLPPMVPWTNARAMSLKLSTDWGGVLLSFTPKSMHNVLADSNRLSFPISWSSKIACLTTLMRLVVATVLSTLKYWGALVLSTFLSNIHCQIWLSTTCWAVTSSNFFGSPSNGMFINWFMIAGV